MADQDQTPAPIADPAGDVPVNDLAPHVEAEPAQSIEGEAVKGGGINRIVVTDGKISGK